MEKPNNESDAENELLSIQLRQLKEELDYYFRNIQELELGREEETRESERKFQEVKSRMEHELQVRDDSFRRRLQTLEKDLQERKSIISAHVRYNTLLTGTLSWKLFSLPQSIKTFFRRLKKPEPLRNYIRLLRESGLFDEQWYLARNPDVALAHDDPIEHYLRHGGFEGRDPSPLFNTLYYLENNPDVAADGVNPLLHYIQYGFKEGRRPLYDGNPLIDASTDT